MSTVTDITLINELKCMMAVFFSNIKDNGFPKYQKFFLEKKQIKDIKNNYIFTHYINKQFNIIVGYNYKVYLINELFEVFLLEDNGTSKNLYNNIMTDSLGFLIQGYYDSKEHIFEILDCLSIYSCSIKSNIFYDRYDSMIDIINVLHIDGLLLKKPKFYRSIDDIVNMDKFNILFIPLNYNYNSHYYIWLHEITFYFKIIEDYYYYTLYILKKNNYVKFASTVKEDNILFNKLIKERCSDFKSGSIVLCVLSNDNFYPVKLVNDNNLVDIYSHVEKKINFYKNNIMLEDLIQ